MNLFETIKIEGLEYKYNNFALVFEDEDGEQEIVDVKGDLEKVMSEAKYASDYSDGKHIGYIAYASLHVEVDIFHETEWELSNTLLPLEIDLNGDVTNAEEIEADIKRMEKMREIW